MQKSWVVEIGWVSGKSLKISVLTLILGKPLSSWPWFICKIEAVRLGDFSKILMTLITAKK